MFSKIFRTLGFALALVLGMVFLYGFIKPLLNKNEGQILDLVWSWMGQVPPVVWMLGIPIALVVLCAKWPKKWKWLLPIGAVVAALFYLSASGLTLSGFSTPRTSDICTGRHATVTLSHNWFEYNPNGSCRTVENSLYGDYEYKDDFGVFPKNGSQQRIARWIRATGTQARLEYALCPRNLMEKTVGFDCEVLQR